MIYSRVVSSIVLALGLASITAGCGLAKKTPPPPAPQSEAKKEVPPLIDPEALKKDPELAKWIERTTPGAAHDRLSPYVGNFKHTVRFWKDSHSAPELSFGTNDNRFIFGGRYFVQRMQGSVRGEAFEGMGITAFDNVRGEYISTWYDSSTTGVMIATGNWSEKNRTIVERGTMTDFNTGKKNVAFRGVWQFIDPDHYTYEMYTPEIVTKGKGKNKKVLLGKEYKSMEVVYERVKKQ